MTRRELAGLLRVFEDFLDGGQSIVDVAKAVFAECDHTEFDGLLFHDDAGAALVDEFADGVGDVHEFVDALAAFVAGVVAGVASEPVVEMLVADLVWRESELAEHGFAWFVGFAAFLANFSDEALCEDGFEGGGEQEGLDAHVNKAGYGARCVVGVEGGEYKVAGEGCLDGDLRCLDVARFADHDAVWVLAEEGAEDAGEIEADTLLDGHLDDALDVVFHGVFAGQNLGVDGVDLVEAGVKRGCFPGACRAGDDEDAVGLLDGVEEVVVDVIGHPECLQLQLNSGTIQYAKHHAFAKLGGQCADAQIDLPTADDFLNAAILRDTSFGDV